jgi:hypothetical protein
MPLVSDNGNTGVQTHYPDRLRRSPGYGGQTQTFVAGPLEPIPNPPPPTELTWWPHYPDRLSRAGSVLAPPSLFQWPMVPIANTEWRASYPDRLRRKTLPVADMPAWFGILGVQSAIATGMFWSASYPSLLRRALSVPPSQTVYPIQGSTILTAASCVEWTDETVVRPELTEEGFRRPGMACQTQEVGFLLLEDGGFLLLEDGGKIELEDQTANACETFVRPTLTGEDWC